MRLLIKGLDSKLKILEINLDKIKNFADFSREFIYEILCDKFDITRLDLEIAFSNNGKYYKSHDLISEEFNNKLIEVKIIVRGGKGGFGSLLKGQPPVKKRTNNFDSCRDLSGRRIRHVNQERMLREWQQKKMEEERLLKALNNPDEENNVKNYIDSDNRKAVHKLNKKFIEETSETTGSISESIKFLLKKKKRESTVEDHQPKLANNIISKNSKLLDIEINLDNESLEKELYS